MMLRYSVGGEYHERNHIVWQSEDFDKEYNKAAYSDRLWEWDSKKNITIAAEKYGEMPGRYFITENRKKLNGFYPCITREK